jgi:hypothetical protein
MGRPRTLGFRIDVGAVALSVGLCVASVFVAGTNSSQLFFVGAIMFVPTSVRLASRISGRPIFPPTNGGPAPMPAFLQEVVWIVLGLLALGRFTSLTGEADGLSFFHVVDGLAAVVGIGAGVFGIAKIILKHLRLRNARSH